MVSGRRLILAREGKEEKQRESLGSALSIMLLDGCGVLPDLEVDDEG